MTKTRIRTIAEQLLVCYRELHELSKRQQQSLSGQIDTPISKLTTEREILFRDIERLQNEFLREERELLAFENPEIHVEIQNIRKSFEEVINQIITSDRYLNILLQERKRQVYDQIQGIQQSQHATTIYKKMFQKRDDPFTMLDYSRFYDQQG
jgi:hypothetical protein